VTKTEAPELGRRRGGEGTPSSLETSTMVAGTSQELAAAGSRLTFLGAGGGDLGPAAGEKMAEVRKGEHACRAANAPAPAKAAAAIGMALNSLGTFAPTAAGAASLNCGRRASTNAATSRLIARAAPKAFHSVVTRNTKTEPMIWALVSVITWSTNGPLSHMCDKYGRNLPAALRWTHG
jgi:hypothetical protein